jgi:excisionase family DNA binding protein
MERKQDTKEMLTVKEVAQQLSVSVSTVYKAIEAGALPAYKIQGAIRVKSEDLDQYLEHNKITVGE